jgi:hypothetical protein
MNAIQIGRSSKATFLICGIFAIGASLGCGSQLKLNSNWPDTDIVIDGQQNEWPDNLTFVEKENVSIGVFNDSEFLYLSLVTTNQTIRRQMMGLGFTVWFDGDGGKDKTLGIHYPIGIFGNGAMMPGRPARNGDDTPERDFEMALQEFELIGPGKDERQKFPANGAKRVEIKIDNSGEALIYEIKIPLNKSTDHPYAIEAEAGKSISVGFETSEFDRETFREKMGGRGGTGVGRPGDGPSGLPPGGIGRRGRMGGRFERPEPFKLWTSIKLATASKSSILDE